MYGKDWTRRFQRRIDEGRLRYYSKERPPGWTRRILKSGLRLPGRGQSEGAVTAHEDVLTKEDVVKASGGEPFQPAADGGDMAEKRGSFRPGDGVNVPAVA